MYETSLKSANLEIARKTWEFPVVAFGYITCSEPAVERQPQAPMTWEPETCVSQEDLVSHAGGWGRGHPDCTWVGQQPWLRTALSNRLLHQNLKSAILHCFLTFLHGRIAPGLDSRAEESLMLPSLHTVEDRALSVLGEPQTSWIGCLWTGPGAFDIRVLPTAYRPGRHATNTWGCASSNQHGLIDLVSP